MTRSLSTAARRTVISTLAALALASAFFPPGFAADLDAGVWSVNPATSKFSGGSAMLSVQRAASANPTGGSLLVISRGNVYLVMGAAASDALKGVKQVAYSNIKDGSVVLIGTHAHSTDYCGFRCMQGAAEPRMTVIFAPTSTGEQRVNEMLVANGQRR